MTPAQRHNGEDKEILAERKAVYNQAKAITKLSLPNKLEKIGVQALRDCSQVKKVTFKTSKAKVGSEAFATDDGVYHLDVKGGKGSHLKKS